MAAAPKELQSSLTKLSLHSSSSNSSSSLKNTQQPVSESWEDEEMEDSGDDTDRPLSPQQSTDYPAAPPPTPISPRSHETFINPYGYGVDMDGSGDDRSERLGTRPEKTDAVAKRMIAGALGVRAPKKTEEQKAYDKAIKEKEIKRRSAEKEAAAKAKEDADRAKAAVWED